MMKWTKIGNIYTPTSTSPFLLSHASNPLAVHLEDAVFRIYFSARDAQNRSSVSSFDFDLAKQQVVAESPEPLFVFGSPDSFYSHGISVGCSYQVGTQQYLLFMGWQIPPNQHWRGDMGRLKCAEGNRLLLDPPTPFLGIDGVVDPLSLSYPWVLYEDGMYKMWYGSTLSWSSENGEMVHVIQYATSLDGVSWERHGQAIPSIIGVAQAFSRPCIIHDANGYHAWFSYRSGTGTTYRIGYARSTDGVDWQLALESTGIDVSPSGWDSEMICYPFVFDFNGKRYMLYNGNGYGKTGVGLAFLDA